MCLLNSVELPGIVDIKIQALRSKPPRRPEEALCIFSPIYW